VIETDRAKLKHVLINLISNALKFSTRGDMRIVLATDPQTNHPTRIDVIDTGVGIPADRLEITARATTISSCSTTTTTRVSFYAVRSRIWGVEWRRPGVSMRGWRSPAALRRA
jgi:sensor histidine kinase regulating citrate/malate metabolism